MPFENQMSRDLHFEKHGHEFGAPDAAAYEQMAEEFMFGVRNGATLECTQPNHGCRLRFDQWNRRFGAAQSVAPEFLKTFYRVEQRKINRYASPMAYFGYECGRISV